MQTNLHCPLKFLRAETRLTIDYGRQFSIGILDLVVVPNRLTRLCRQVTWQLLLMALLMSLLWVFSLPLAITSGRLHWSRTLRKAA